ncbi:MAG TPA: flagellar hook capping FlgD N-terminal domain-containing protein [Candidatus Competibacter sp.]|nr:flagellar hook capping FlgD N-terminal domain-containing protein [Candidatus Competibacter sp.]
MTTISSTGTAYASSSTSSTAATEKKANDQLDQADFLRLMTTQLRNQDPNKPLDGQQFMAQLAQFSTLNAIMDMKTSLDKLVKALGVEQ